MRNVSSPAQQLPEEAVHPPAPPLSQYPVAPTSTSSVANPNNNPNSAMSSIADEKRDITMTGGGISNQQPQSVTAPGATANSANSHNNTSTTPIPQVRAGGAPARVYLNERIVPYLLEEMKTLAKEQPSNPLRVLGEYLIQKSNEIEES
ncbi:hypothetical protein AJ79_01281 [Helicocarpus griseus UAMH5409]|uniref:RIIa domain-containing protein n=1 Tax=Helicocarpus griseus UAMH5409 TaxID=1447875 RepID=A0A2B7Y7Y3_9EURO|nr:hypothetical protein AJ79_01281 [Helicocarpus griseus UAMH5409]